MATATSEAKEILEDLLKPSAPTQYIDSGNIGFDMALTNGRGMPLGASVLLWAEPGCGKTSLFVDVSKRLIKKHKAEGVPYKVLYLAIEDSRELMTALGMDELMQTGDFMYVPKAFCWRQIGEIFEKVLAGKAPWNDIKLVIIDSVNNVLSDQNLKNSIADGDFGTKARERGNFYTKYLPSCKEKGINTFFVSQIRQKTEAGVGMFVEKKRAAVTDADLHNVDVIIKCSAKVSAVSSSVDKTVVKTAFGEVKESHKYIMTLDSTKTSCKNRYGLAHPVEIAMEKGVGVNNAYVLWKLLLGHKFITYRAGWVTFKPELCSLGIPDGKMRIGDAEGYIKEHAGELVDFLKKMDCYRVDLEPKKSTKKSDFEDFMEVEENATEETVGDEVLEDE